MLPPRESQPDPTVDDVDAQAEARRRTEAARRRKIRAQARKAVEKYVAKARMPSPPPTKRQLARMSEAAAQDAERLARWDKILEKARLPSPLPRKKRD